MMPYLSPASMDVGSTSRVTINKFDNGWLVVYDPGRSESASEDFGMDLISSLMPMMVVAKEQGRASARGVEEELDSWKQDILEAKDEEDLDKLMDKLKRLGEKLKEHRKDRNGGGTQVKVFNDYTEMMAFVAKIME